MFFGLGWPLLCLVALSYFQSRILPTSALGIFFYVVTSIGHYGLITALLYFLFYVPLVCIFPNYYFTRLWSLFLIMLAAIAIFIDSLIFSLYRVHINSFIIDLIVDGAGKELFKLHPSVFIIAVTMFLAVIGYFWVRGERTWRSMQRKFSNPNKNWYIVLIIFFVVLSHVLHLYGDAKGNRIITRNAQTFPLYFPITAHTLLADAGWLPEKVASQPSSVRDFNYPAEKMNCFRSYNNILLITVNDWNASALNDFDTPRLKHYAKHGNLFNAHRSGSTKVTGGLFTLLYGLSEMYLKPAKLDHVSPVFLDEIQRRESPIGFFTDFSMDDSDLRQTIFSRLNTPKVSTNMNEDWRNWLENYLSSDIEKSFFGMLAFKSPKEIDLKIAEIIEGLHAKGLIKKTIVIITGINGNKVPDVITVPLLMLWPEMQFEENKFPTSHFDIVPTIMAEEWKCTNPVDTYSDGQSILNSKPKDYYVMSTERGYQIIDYQKKHVITVDPLTGYSVTDFSLRPLNRTEARMGLILFVLREQSRFRAKK